MPVIATEQAETLDLGVPSAMIIDKDGESFKGTVDTYLDVSDLASHAGYKAKPFIRSVTFV